MPYVRDHCFFLAARAGPNAPDRFPVVPVTTLLEQAADAAGEASRGGGVSGCGTYGRTAGSLSPRPWTRDHRDP